MHGSTSSTSMCKTIGLILTIQWIVVSSKRCSNTYSRHVIPNISMYMSACQKLSEGINTNYPLCGQKCLHKNSKCPAFVLDTDICWICYPRTDFNDDAKSIPKMEKSCKLEVYIKKGSLSIYSIFFHITNIYQTKYTSPFISSNLFDEIKIP